VFVYLIHWREMACDDRLMSQIIFRFRFAFPRLFRNFLIITNSLVACLVLTVCQQFMQMLNRAICTHTHTRSTANNFRSTFDALR
jgi:hypothetical protein